MKTNRILNMGYRILAGLLMLGCVAPLRAADAEETKELRDFIGAVYEKRGSWTLTSGQNALGERGCIRKVGNNYFTPDGDTVVTTGTSWLSGEGAVISTGTTYLGGGRNKVSTRSTVLDAEVEK